MRWFVKAGIGVFALFLLSGCSLSSSGGGNANGGSIWKSFDSGKTFVPKVTVDAKRKITSADVLSFAFNPQDSEMAYVGTVADGIFRTTDGAEHWEKMNFPPGKVYGIAVDHLHPERVFASGVYNKVAKIYRTEDSGQNWSEVYTEPGPDTVITALSMHRENPQVLYAATDRGVVIKTTDGGAQWKNIYDAKNPVTRILIGRGNPESVTILLHEKGVRFSADGGAFWNEFDNSISGSVQNVRPEKPISLTADPNNETVIYAGGSNGLLRSSDYGKTWTSLPVIESSKQYPTRSIAVNPQNGDEIIFASGAAFYRTTDGGQHWAVTELSINRGVSVIVYKPGNPEILYFGLRNYK